MSLQLELGRWEFPMVGSNQRHTMRVLPFVKNKRQKVAIGDESGIVHVFVRKNQDGQEIWKSSPGKREVTALTLTGSRDFKDKIVVALGQTIVAYKKKLAEQFKFDARLKEDIMNIYSEDQTVWASGKYVFSVYEDQNDTFLYQPPDLINHFTMQTITSNKKYNAILACQDKCIRVLQDGDQHYQVPVNGAATVVIPYIETSNDGDDTVPIVAKGESTDSNLHETAHSNNFKPIIYGTDNGLVGKLLLDVNDYSSSWIIPNDEKKSGVTTLTSFDISQDGVNDIIVGRDDGTVEIYGMGPDEPQKLFHRNMNESITAFDKGRMVGVDHEDLVVSTYAGTIACFTHENKSNVAHIRPKANFITSASKKLDKRWNEKDKAKKKDSHATIDKLKKECEKLTQKLQSKKEQYKKLSENMIAVRRQFKVKSSLKFLPDEACYLITIEIPIALDVVTFQSNIDALLLDSTPASTIKYQPPVPPNKKNIALLATYKCQESHSTNRLAVKVRTLEGRCGMINVYVIPRLTPKTSQKVMFNIKPLSLHTKVPEELVLQELEKRPKNSLIISGNRIPLNEIHSWICACLPDVPPRMIENEGKLSFRSTLFQTVLHCEYQAGKATFLSDSITCISILKEVITDKATDKKILVNSNIDIHPKSVLHCLELLRPSLDHHFLLEKRHALIKPLQEIAAHEEDTTYLSAEYKDIIQNAETIARDFNQAPGHVAFLKEIVKDLFSAKYKLEGRRVGTKMRAIESCLEQYEYNNLVSIFKDSK